MTSLTKPRVRSLADIDRDAIPPATLYLGNWLTDRHLSMVFADAGVGKSMFGLSLALTVAGGGRLFDRWDNTIPRRVLIVDGEMDVRDFQDRTRMLVKAIPGIDRRMAFQNIMIMARLDQRSGDFINIATPDGRAHVLASARLHQADLIILDNYSTLAEVEDENASSSFDSVQNLMLDLKADARAVILIHHTNKSGGFRGTSKMTAVMNTTIKLAKPVGSSGSEGTHFTLSFEKFRGKRDASTVGDFTAKLEHDHRHAVTWFVESAHRDKVEEAVRLNKSGDYGTDTSIAGAMRVDRATVGRYRVKAIEAGLIDAHEWNNNLRIGKLRQREASSGETDITGSMSYLPCGDCDEDAGDIL